MIVNRSIAAQGTGYKVKDGINYAWNPGLPSVISDQKVEVRLLVVEQVDQLWWRVVLESKDWKRVRGRPDPDSSVSTPGVGIDHQVKRLTPAEVDARVASADSVLIYRRKAYSL